jgi:hypothetical protein
MVKAIARRIATSPMRFVSAVNIAAASDELF